MKSNDGTDSVYREWKKSTKQADGLEKTVKVCEAENGFVVKVVEEGFIEASQEYIHNSKTYISTKNPLEGTTEDKKEANADLKSAIKDMIKSW